MTTATDSIGAAAEESARAYRSREAALNTPPMDRFASLSLNGNESVASSIATDDDDDEYDLTEVHVGADANVVRQWLSSDEEISSSALTPTSARRRRSAKCRGSSSGRRNRLLFLPNNGAEDGNNIKRTSPDDTESPQVYNPFEQDWMANLDKLITTPTMLFHRPESASPPEKVL